MSQSIPTNQSSNSTHSAAPSSSIPRKPLALSSHPPRQQTPPRDDVADCTPPSIENTSSSHIAGDGLSSAPPARTSRSAQYSKEQPCDVRTTRRSWYDATVVDTPKSSFDSEGVLQYQSEETEGVEHMHDEEVHSQQSRNRHGPSASLRELTSAPRSSEASALDLASTGDSPEALRSNNPYRRGNSERALTSGVPEGIDGVVRRLEVRDDSTETPAETKASSLVVDQSYPDNPPSYRPLALPFRGSTRDTQGPAPGSSLDVPRSDLSTQLGKSAGECQLPLIGCSPNRPGLSDAVVGSVENPAGSLDKESPLRPQRRSHDDADLRFSNEDDPIGPSATKSRNSVIDADIAKLGEQRNETYQIKHFNWFDYNRRTLRTSSMLTQNVNGPCPLLALVNALILEVEDDSRSALGAALRAREQVSLGLIIESLMDELTSEGRGSELIDLPDVDELNRFLLMLHSGMTANPLLSMPAPSPPNLIETRSSSLHLPLSLNDDVKPGTFEDTLEMRLYAAFAVPLVHGWLAPRSDPARAAFARSARTYEDAQTILFREEELEEKMSQTGLSAEEQDLLQDMAYIKAFLETYPTQITPHGLDILNGSLFPGAFAILFRNSHFNTIYKHPESGVLYTLVTDAGYSDKDEVVWESLVDVSGQKSEFFSGDFRPVGGDRDAHDAYQAEPGLTAGPDLSTDPNTAAAATSPSQNQEQADADYAMALQLHEEETAAQMDETSRSVSDRQARHRYSTSNTSRSRQQQETTGPTIPPRGNHANAISTDSSNTSTAPSGGVSRPTDPSQTSNEHHDPENVPPPAYEEAAKSKPYLPPHGHPQHSPFDPRSPSSSAPPSTPWALQNSTIRFPRANQRPSSTGLAIPSPGTAGSGGGGGGGTGLRRPNASIPVRGGRTYTINNNDNSNNSNNSNRNSNINANANANSNNVLGGDIGVGQGQATTTAKQGREKDNRNKDCMVM